MEDKEAIEVLTRMLTKYSFDEDEAEAIRSAIGVFSWTKLVEAWKENKKRNRDKKLSDAEDSPSSLF